MRAKKPIVALMYDFDKTLCTKDIIRKMTAEEKLVKEKAVEVRQIKKD